MKSKHNVTYSWDSDWFFNMLDLALKNARITSWVWIWNTLGLRYWTWIDFIKHWEPLQGGQGGRPLQKYEYFLVLLFSSFYNCVSSYSFIFWQFVHDDISIHITVLYTALGIACHYHIYQYYIYNVSPFFNVIISKRTMSMLSF